MAEFAIETHDLRIDYGDFTAVQSLSLKIPAGSIFGLVGPNGAGKTSTIRALTGLLEPTYGEIWMNGIDLREKPQDAFRILGYMPDLAPVIPDLTVQEFLTFYAGMYQLPCEERSQRVDEVLRKVKMEAAREKLCASLSRGMTQRVVLAKTLLHRPSILLLDEPASGMDPIARLDLKDTLRELQQTGTTVLISSHILSELSEMCTHLAIMHKGDLRSIGTVQFILNQVQSTQRTLKIATVEEDERLAQFLKDLRAVSGLQSENNEIRCQFSGSDDDLAQLLKSLIQKGLLIRAFEPGKSGLEDILRQLDDEE
jgi:ABC-2 type transport system ATP-binding protein